MRLRKYLKPYWYFALLAPFSMFLEVIFLDLLQPRMLANIVNNGVLAEDMSVVLGTGGLMILFVVIGGICGLGAAVFASSASQRFGRDLRKDVYRKIMHLSLEQTDQFTTGSLVTRLTNDITMVQQLVNMALRMFVRSPMLFIGGIVMALLINTSFAIVIAIALPIQIFLIVLILKKASPMFSVVQKKLDAVNSVVQENVSGARVVKAYVREEHEIGRFDKANTGLRDTTYGVQRLMAWLSPVLMIIMNASVIAIIYIGDLQVEARAIEVGDIMAVITYITQILMSMMMVAMMFQTLTRAAASAKRILEVLDSDPVLENGTVQEHDGAGEIVYKNVSFQYPNTVGRSVLADVDLTIKPGEYVAILGATGSGKSSLVNLIPRFYDVTGGKLTVDGVDVREYDLATLRNKIALVLQKTELFAGTVADNIRWGREDATDDEVVEAAKIAQADGFISEFRDGYATMIGEKGMSLSGGQKQRVAVARAVLRKPEIIIFDDSTSALDLGTEAKLRAALRERLRNTTVVMIAQRVASVMHADKIAVLDGGRIVACDTHEQLLENCAVYRDIYNSQIGGAQNG